LRKLKQALFALVVGVAVAVAGQVEALTFEVGCVTGNDASDCAIGEAQFAIDVTISGTVASFEFTNTGPDRARITDIYFSDPTSFFDPSTAVLSATGNVVFSRPATPTSWGALGFRVDYSWGSRGIRGIDTGESLTIAMQMSPGVSLSEDDIARARFQTGTFDIGLKAGAFASGGSEGFKPIPEARAGLLFAAGLLLVSGGLRSRPYPAALRA
jgi:hypothetical protein